MTGLLGASVSTGCTSAEQKRITYRASTEIGTVAEPLVGIHLRVAAVSGAELAEALFVRVFPDVPMYPSRAFLHTLLAILVMPACHAGISALRVRRDGHPKETP